MKKNSVKSCLKKEVSVTHPKKVLFDQITVLEFPIILGDNPTPINGIPITIGWKPQKMMMLDIHAFERYRPARRTKEELLLSPLRRVQMVLLGGWFPSDIRKTRLEVIDIQFNRAMSSQKSGWERLKEMMVKRPSKEQDQAKFTIVPSDALAVLQGWKTGVERPPTSFISCRLDGTSSRNVTHVFTIIDLNRKL
jgi:hypothetical protein